MKHDLLKVHRLEGLTDGLFATAMTVLVFSVNLPTDTTASNLPRMISSDILQIIFIYAGSFIILGTQWVKINLMHGFLERVNRPYLWANILYLIPAGIVPFSTSVLIDYPSSHISMIFYVINLMFSNFIQFIVWQCGKYYKLYNSMYNSHVNKLLMYRIFVPFVFYISSLIIAHWNVTIAFIILILQPLYHLIPGKIDAYLNKHPYQLE